ncbi:MAG TPA: response regulator transcription factor [Solirubrobacteraceae bacterium]|nr:response regulator transcription factor [Solirubrobacteraceae bacterium]
MPSVTSPRLHVVSPGATLRARLVATLSESPFPVTSACTSVDELDFTDAEGTSVVVLASLGSPTRRAAIVRSLAQRDKTFVIVCRDTGHAEVRRLIHAGAYGYVLERELERTLIPTVAAVLAGQIAIPKEERMQVGAPTLSAREKQVLGMVVMGYMNCDIAQQLYLAEGTVKSHLSSAFLKLGVRSRSEAVDLILDAEQGLGRGILAITSDGTNGDRA